MKEGIKEMEDILKIIGEYGILIVIAAVFIWDKVANTKTTENILKELEAGSKVQTSILENLRHTCENQSIALSIIQNSLAMNTTSLERHDKRSEYMNADVREICTLLRVRPCIFQSEEQKI